VSARGSETLWPRGARLLFERVEASGNASICASFRFSADT